MKQAEFNAIAESNNVSPELLTSVWKALVKEMTPRQRAELLLSKEYIESHPEECEGLTFTDQHLLVLLLANMIADILEERDEQTNKDA